MTDLVKSISVQNMVNQRAAIMQRLSDVSSLLKEAAEIAERGGFGKLGGLVRSGHYEKDAFDSDWLPRMEKAIDANGWKHLMNESGIRTFMDSTAREEWDDVLMRREAPALTEANINDTFLSLYAARSDFLERGVIKTFKGLSWDYKTNLPQKYGKRIVMTYFHQPQWFSCDSKRADMLDDLIRVFCVIDGVPEPDHRHGIREQHGEAHRAKQNTMDTKYMSFKWFKNGNAHITFKRLDLIDKLNQILAKHYPNALAAPK